MMTYPWQSLGFFKPSSFDAKYIGEHLTEWTCNIGAMPASLEGHRLHRKLWFDEALHADVVHPSFGKTADLEWHRDGVDDPRADQDIMLALWASTHPTQINFQGEIWQPQDFEFILVPNHMHRRPPNVPHLRWTFRQRLLREEYSL